MEKWNTTKQLSVEQQYLKLKIGLYGYKGRQGKQEAICKNEATIMIRNQPKLSNQVYSITTNTGIICWKKKTEEKHKDPSS